jgi:hypothetical protein
MVGVAQALVLALAVTGLAGVGVAGLPMQKAIDGHNDHLGPDSKLPEQAQKGQQNALEHLLENQDRWVARNHTADSDSDLNETESSPKID